MIRVRNLLALSVFAGLFVFAVGCGPTATTAPKKDDMMKKDEKMMKEDGMMKKEDGMMKKDDKMKKDEK